MVQNRKTAVITGGNSGIGFETAKVLARLDWRVIITGRNKAKLNQATTALLDKIQARNQLDTA